MNSLEQTKTFQDLLLDYSHEADSDKRAKIEQTLWDEYGQSLAVMILDMSGFSLLAQRYGIVHYLSMIRRMQLITAPIIEAHGGYVVKYEADNCFAAFPKTKAAIAAGIAINKAFTVENESTPDEFDIRVACGIDFGQILLIGGKDYFGNAVNRASKLGEDIANPGELLVTKEAWDTLKDDTLFSGKPMKLVISGIEMDAISVQF
ncbi:MAG: adenylate/guanylate cyclase domain-containing protein [Hahellaceae bacterium]|nr:adenylate/guanylate cyclase domain-containing protein [Hahellaceae bacterium]